MNPLEQPAPDAAHQILLQAWGRLRYSCTPADLSSIGGQIIMAYQLGLLNNIQLNTWSQRILHCPGHALPGDEKDPLTYCCYCGPLTPEHPINLTPVQQSHAA